MRKKIAGFISVCCFLLCFGSVASAATPMPEFSLSDAVTGEMVNSSEFSGKALIVTFFTTW